MLPLFGSRACCAEEGYNMVLVIPQVIHAACTPKLADFPFDTQHCSLQFGDWSASGRYFEFDTIQSGNVSFKLQDYNKEYEIISISAEKGEALDTGLMDRTTFPSVSYMLSLKRYP